MLLDHIDQLDLALDQLALKDRNFDRFAIMLVDNVVELTLHRHAVDAQIREKAWYRSEQSRFTAKELQAALGQRFDAKVVLALKTGLLTKPMSQSIKWLHSFRNSSYHAGLRHEGILHSLANFYVLNCCDLLMRYSPLTWAFGSEKLSHRAAKYLGEADLVEMMWKPRETFVHAWQRLRAVAANMQCDLIADLKRDMGNLIDHVDDQIGFIASNAPGRPGYSRNQVVVDAQAWALAFTDRGVQYAKQNGYPGVLGRGPKLAMWLEENYEAPFPIDPIPSWRDRLRSIGEETDAGTALDKYCNFIAQTVGVRDDLAQRARHLDSYIQEQIDRRRGK